MSTVIVPSLTNQMVLAYFEFLVQAELKKRQDGSFDFHFGVQEGAIGALSMLFGQSDEATQIRAYDTGGTWLQIAERIVEDSLGDWVSLMENNDELTDDDTKALKLDIRKAVTEYALVHAKKMIDALKHNI